MRTLRFAAQIALVSLGFVAGCTDEQGSAAPTQAEIAKKEAKKEEARKKIVAVTTPVPYGKKIPCSQLVDAAKISAVFGRQVEVKDDAKSNADATSVCAFHLVGKALTAKEQEKKFKENDMKIGVLPGDEICRVEAFCWYPYDIAEEKTKCEAQAVQRVTSDFGELTCVRATEKGPDYHYTYKVIDSDTRCMLQTGAGPSVNEEEVVKACAKAVVETIGPEQIKVM